MKALEPEQWRVLGSLVSACGARVRLHDTLKSQDVSPEAVCDLAERGLISAKLKGEGIELLTTGLVNAHRREIDLSLSKAGDSYYYDDPHRVLGSLGRAQHGLTLRYLLGMVHLESVVSLHGENLLYALTEADTVDLTGARQPFSGSERLILPGGVEHRVDNVIVRVTKGGYLYCHR